jgi:DNA-directed RNA polymerase subunit RPC12/RpoP
MLELVHNKTKITVEEDKENNKVTVWIPRCPKCGERLVKGLYKYRPDDKRNVSDTVYSSTFGNLNHFVYFMYICNKHRDQRFRMDGNQLGLISTYPSDHIVFRNIPKN